jgi:hypothetical protein
MFAGVSTAWETSTKQLVMSTISRKRAAADVECVHCRPEAGAWPAGSIAEISPTLSRVVTPLMSPSARDDGSML